MPSSFSFDFSISFKKLFEGFLVFEVGFFLEAAFGQQFDEARLAKAAAKFCGSGLIFLNVKKKSGQAGAFKIDAFLGFDDVIFGGALHELVSKIAFIADVAFGFAALHAIERRLRDVNVAAIDELFHVAEEKSEEQGADVAAIDVRVGHENDFVIAQLGGVEIVFADAGAERGDDGANFFVAEHFVVARFFDVEDLALEGRMA